MNILTIREGAEMVAVESAAVISAMPADKKKRIGESRRHGRFEDPDVPGPVRQVSHGSIPGHPLAWLQFTRSLRRSVAPLSGAELRTIYPHPGRFRGTRPRLSMQPFKQLIRIAAQPRDRPWPRGLRAAVSLPSQ